MRPHLQLGRYTLEYWHEGKFSPIEVFRVENGRWYSLWFGRRIRIGRNIL